MSRKGSGSRYLPQPLNFAIINVARVIRATWMSSRYFFGQIHTRCFLAFFRLFTTTCLMHCNSHTRTHMSWLIKLPKETISLIWIWSDESICNRSQVVRACRSQHYPWQEAGLSNDHCRPERNKWSTLCDLCNSLEQFTKGVTNSGRRVGIVKYRTLLCYRIMATSYSGT